MALFLRRNKSARKTSNEEKRPAPDPGTNPDTGSVSAGLNKSRSSLRQGLGRLLGSRSHLDSELFDQLEELLISSDVGVGTSMDLVESLRLLSKRQRIGTPAELVTALQKEAEFLLSDAEQDWNLSASPYVILMVGVNGVGKTTTTAKIAHHLQRSGRTVMLAAADTFRAAAVDQLREWGNRLEIPVIAQAEGADAAAVAHDALTAATARGTDVLIIDTAGRLHTQLDLMGQLEKMKRVLARIVPEAPHEVIQVIDAGTGQNALAQIRSFSQSVGVDSVVVTKLDGSARGGVLLALTGEFGLPVRYVGTGEAFEDLRPFRASDYASALIPSDLPGGNQAEA